ncbi:MAG: RpiB/LacA/LacB family sugar-phosphate isomerase [Patescibacteria group bacterium]
MVIHLGTDHAGYWLKEDIKKFLIDRNFEVKDHGAHSYREEDDYPDYIHSVAKVISEKHETDKAIILGGSGQGEAMVCNRYQGVRAAVYYGGQLKIIKLSREHNDANVLALGARSLSKKEALAVVELWLKTKFDSKEKRHMRRIKKIEKC